MSWVSATSAGDASSTFLDIAIPAGSVDDILVMSFYGEGTLGLTLSFDVGTWTKDTNASGQQLGEAIDFEVYRYTARWGSQTGNVRISWGGATLWNSAICVRHSGRITSGAPQDATSTFAIGGSQQTTATATGLTTGHTNADLLLFEANVNGQAHASWSSPLTERVDFHGQGYAEGTQAAAGATGTKTVVLDVPGSWWTAALMALQEAGAAAGVTMMPPPKIRPFPFTPGSPSSPR